MAMNVILIGLLACIVVFEAALYIQFSRGNREYRPYEQDRDRITSTASGTDEEERFHLTPLGNLDEEYMNLFSNPPMDKAARRGKSAYLRDAYHERIRQIVNALNIEGVNISSYVDMVLTDHLMRYEDQIDHLIQNCHNKGKKQWLPS